MDEIKIGALRAATLDVAELADQMLTALYDCRVITEGSRKRKLAYELLNERGNLARTAMARINAAREAVYALDAA